MLTVNLMQVNMIKAIDDLINHKGDVKVIFDNGDVVIMKVRNLIFHLIFWGIGRKWGVTLTPDFIVNTVSVNSDTIGNIGTKILDAARKIHKRYHDIAFDFNDALNYLNNFVIDNCQEYHKSLSILDLVHIADIPEVRAIVTDKVSDMDGTMKEAQDKIKVNIVKLFTELKKPHPGNRIYDFINLRFVSDTQLAHIFYQIGFRTDIDDTVIRYAVQGNYLDGLENMTEYCLETLSAKKSAFYNKDSLPNTEYFGRKQHILLSCIEHLYAGDCGTTVTMPVVITEKLKNMVMYKNIVEGSQIVTLYPENIDKYVGKMVNFRTPIACKYRDGICETCGGKLLASITPNTHIGIFSAIQTTSIITQVVLSAKHIQGTNVIEYIIPQEFHEAFIKSKGNIFIKPKMAEKLKDISLVFPISDASHLLSLGDFDIAKLRSINESSFGTCKGLVILKGGMPVINYTPLESSGQAPMYSKSFIKYVAENQSNVSLKGDMFVVSMKDFNPKESVFKLISINNSMVRFVQNAKKLLESDVKNYHSATELFNDFTDLVYQQVKTNVTYLEVVLRAVMVSGKHDYRLPIVADIENVTFSTNKLVNMNRSLGNLTAFEQAPAAFENPAMYVVPKILTKFDKFLNLKEARSGIKIQPTGIPLS
jgi:hypothetical protein